MPPVAVAITAARLSVGCGSSNASSSTQALSPIAASSASQSRRWSGVTRGLAQVTLMARPIAAGVFGIVRMIAASARWRLIPPIVIPAAIDRNKVCGRTQRR